jgi:hypothetical protein
MQIIQRHSDSKPALIFCSTRKGAQQTAQTIVKQYDALRKASKPLPWAESPEELGPFRNAILASEIPRVIWILTRHD